MPQNVLRSKHIMPFTAYNRDNFASSLLGRSFRIELNHEEWYLGSVPRWHLMFQLHYIFKMKQSGSFWRRSRGGRLRNMAPLAGIPY
jgi:hypothetical protein